MRSMPRTSPPRISAIRDRRATMPSTAISRPTSPATANSPTRKATLTVDRGVNYVKTKAVASADVNLNFAFLFGARTSTSASMPRGGIEQPARSRAGARQYRLDGRRTNHGAQDGDRSRCSIISRRSSRRRARCAPRWCPSSPPSMSTATDSTRPGSTWTASRPTNGINFPVVNGKRPNHMALFKQLMKDPASAAKLTGWKGATGTDTGWKGCVEARPGAFNISDTPPDPSKPDTLFVPYFAPDDPGDRHEAFGHLRQSTTGTTTIPISKTHLTRPSCSRRRHQHPGHRSERPAWQRRQLVLGGLRSADLKTVAKYVAPHEQAPFTATTEQACN